MRVKKYYKLIKVSYEDSAYLRMKNVSNSDGIFKISKVGQWAPSPNLEYSLDGVTWTTYDFSTLPEVQVAAGANIYLRGNNSSGINTTGDSYVKFNMNVNHTLGGNLLSIINKTNPESVTSGLSQYSLSNLFRGDQYLISAAEMNIGNYNTLGPSCFNYLFSGCTSLTTPPDLSNVTTIGMQSLLGMFSGCTSLTTPPDLSNVTTIGYGGCQSMFSECRSLENGPDFSNATSVDQQALLTMFYRCFLLSTVTAPNIQDLTQNNVLTNWLQNAGTSVPSGTTKVVNVPTGATITTGSESGIPTGWTRVDY